MARRHSYGHYTANEDVTCKSQFNGGGPAYKPKQANIRLLRGCLLGRHNQPRLREGRHNLPHMQGQRLS
jgi:hypothetical protein